MAFADTAAIREEIASVVPYCDGIQHLSKKGDHFQYGGPLLCAGWEFPTPDGRAKFFVVDVPVRPVPEGMFLVSTRRGKQFNSMVQERRDPLTGATRDSVLVSKHDAQNHGLSDGDPVVLHNEFGELRGRVRVAALKPGNLQVHWPEGEVLIDRSRRSPEAGIPDYNAVVTLEPETVA